MNNYDENDENGSDVTSIFDPNGSVISNAPDRYGFFGGSQYPDPKQFLPPSVILKRERKWLSMLNDWEKVMTKNYKKVKERCRKGIPPSVRPRAWLYLCSSKSNKKNHEPQYFLNLCNREGHPRWMEDIRKDLHRQFPFHEMFMDQEGHGQKDLFNVLKAYSLHNPIVGYCQAQAPIAAFLLMYMPAEDAFWCLVNICDEYLVGYYSQGMEILQIHGDMLNSLVENFSPHIYKHLKKQKIEPILYMTEWFLCVFTRTLPWPALLRVWDMFLCEGSIVMFKVGLILLNLCLRSKSKSASALKKKYPTMYETVEALRNPPAHLLEEDFLVKHVLRINLTSEMLEAEHRRQRAKRLAMKSNITNNKQ